ncbi:MAG: septal ring lytic transglycosylase RlpA family protein [Thermodesulfobacteriota bacterium]
MPFILRNAFVVALTCCIVWWIGGCAKKVQPLPPSVPPTPAPSPPKAPSTGVPPTSRPYQVFGKWYYPLPDARGFRETGIASWYGKPFHGRKTANGEIYDMYGESAAHKTLPIGTIVRVRNLLTGKEMDIRINDRGPFVDGRIIDLSYGCAQKLDVLGPGTAPVEIVAVGTTDALAQTGKIDKNYYYMGNFTVQVGAFTYPANAEKLKQRLEREGYPHVHVVQGLAESGTVYRVRVTRSTTLEQAQSYEKHFEANGFADAFVVAE